jgi:uncharacterized protein
MLTGDLIRPRLRKRKGVISVDLLASSPPALKTARELIDLFGAHINKRADDWRESLERYMGDRTDYIVVRGLAKVLEDAATFVPRPTPLLPADLRQKLFARGPVLVQPDLFAPQTRTEAIGAVARELDLTPEQIESALFADRPGEYLLLKVGTVWTPESLIGRYNLELSRGVLYWSDMLHIDLYDGYKDFWRYLKLFKLMFWATVREGGGYHIDLDGPISPFVQATTRYGRQFAAFLPALLLSERWNMTASVRLDPGESALEYRLDQSAPLASHFRKSGEFDSRLEANFAAEFAEKFGDERGQWKLTREDEVLLLGDTVMIPDFAFTHKKDGRRALVEIVGFWHPDYLRRKVEKVRAAGRSDLILLVYEGVNLSADRLKDAPGEVLYFANKPVLKDVVAAVERAAK